MCVLLFALSSHLGRTKNTENISGNPCGDSSNAARGEGFRNHHTGYFEAHKEQTLKLFIFQLANDRRKSYVYG